MLYLDLLEKQQYSEVAAKQKSISTESQAGLQNKIYIRQS